MATDEETETPEASPVLRRSTRRRTIVASYCEMNKAAECKRAKREGHESRQRSLHEWTQRVCPDGLSPTSTCDLDQEKKATETPSSKAMLPTVSGERRQRRVKWRTLEFYGMRFCVKGYWTPLPKPKYRQLTLRKAPYDHLFYTFAWFLLQMSVNCDPGHSLFK